MTHRLHHLIGLASSLLLAFACALPVTLADPGPPQSPTVLLAGKITTWLELEQPPYNVAVTLKMKLERAGFRVILDPQQPHDLVLDVLYQETQGREYRRLEHGTNIACELAVWKAAESPQKLWGHRIDTGTSWPTPIGSLYWEAVQKLEENPYYYYVGDLLLGLTSGDDVGSVFTRALRQKPLTFTTDGGGFQPGGHVIANAEARLSAIKELGRLKDKRALPILIDLAGQIDTSDFPDNAQRSAAINAIGEIGDPSSLDALSALYGREGDVTMRTVFEQAMTRIREHP